MTNVPPDSSSDFKGGATSRGAKFGANLADACSSIQGQLDQLLGELDVLDGGQAARARVLSIKNQLAQIAPEASE